eukprot:scaffold223459_cov18-Prasinocladus_malaysianus.AAC.1
MPALPKLLYGSNTLPAEFSPIHLKRKYGTEARCVPSRQGRSFIVNVVNAQSRQRPATARGVNDFQATFISQALDNPFAE